MNPEWVKALSGGVIIGLAVSLMLLGNGRVTGISGIINGAFQSNFSDRIWRLLFILGLFVGGLLMSHLNPQLFVSTISADFPTVIIAGVLVGFGTLVGSGCTSGHGVCGLSRWSLRSLVATVTFMMAGVVTVLLVRHLGGF